MDCTSTTTIEINQYYEKVYELEGTTYNPRYVTNTRFRKSFPSHEQIKTFLLTKPIKNNATDKNGSVWKEWRITLVLS